MSQPIILLAGATGDLGSRITKSLLERGALVRALVRTDAKPSDQSALRSQGVTVLTTDDTDTSSMTGACQGAACVISALNGLHAVIVDRQTALLDAAVRAGVPRFISSDFSADFTKTEPGRNRNLDLRREFMVRANTAPIRVTSIFNGAFMDMLGIEMPLIQRRISRILCWRDADQLLDFTTKDNVASYTAAAALDESTPRILRIAGDSISSRGIAAAMSKLTGRSFRTLRVGGIASLSILIQLAKILAPQPRAAFPPWQGMQYLRDMFTGQGKLTPLDNDRYSGLRWTSVLERLGWGMPEPIETK